MNNEAEIVETHGSCSAFSNVVGVNRQHHSQPCGDTAVPTALTKAGSCKKKLRAVADAAE